MRNWRLTIIVLVVIALAAGIWAFVETTSMERVPLAHAWQLTDTGHYRATAITDPFVSWAPDSRSLLFGYRSNVSRTDRIVKWNVGEKTMQFVTEGVSPIYVTNDEFLYLTREPIAIYRRSLSTGKKSQVLASIKNDPFWADVKGFDYDPASKTIFLRLTEFTPGYLSGTVAYDLTGKRLPEPNTYKGDGVRDRSCKPGDRTRCAVIVEARETRPASLQIADGVTGKEGVYGKEVATGTITSVAWHPADDLVAYGDDTSVALVKPSDGRTAVVARFKPPKQEGEKAYVARLSWSPNGEYLAVFYYMSSNIGDYPLIYALDLSAFRWPE